jgi:hypothetical protein
VRKLNFSQRRLTIEKKSNWNHAASHKTNKQPIFLRAKSTFGKRTLNCEVPVCGIAGSNDKDCPKSGKEGKAGCAEGEVVEFGKHEGRGFEERVENAIEKRC